MNRSRRSPLDILITNRKITVAKVMIGLILEANQSISDNTTNTVYGIKDWITANNHITDKQYRTIYNICFFDRGMD